jgi:hypothetical protein
MIVLVLVSALVAQTPIPSASPTTAQLRARCSQLITFYDRYGVGRSNNSDGRRNHTRLAAEFDCARGDFAKGIAEMEALFKRKAFTPPPSGLPNEIDYDE